MNRSVLLALLLTACTTDDKPVDIGDLLDDTGITPAVTDADGDGSPAGEDCDDANAAVYPDAEEACNDEIDNDCNGLADMEEESCVALCAFPTDIIDNTDDDEESGLEEMYDTVDLANELIISKAAGSPFGYGVPGLGATLLLDFWVPHAECPSVHLNSITFEVIYTDNEGSGWSPERMIFEVEDENISELTDVSGPPYTLYGSFVSMDYVMGGSASSIGAATYVDTSGASAVEDDSTRTDLYVDSVEVTIAGTTVILAQERIQGGTIVY